MNGIVAHDGLDLLRNRTRRALRAMLGACGCLLVTASGVLAQPQKVAANGAFTTRFDIPVPPAPNAPAASLVYDSGSAGGLGGVGWDLSVGWPTLIARDTRFGTPSWTLSSAWVWGASPLVVTDASRAQCELTGACHYRVAPDNLAAVTIRRTQPFQYRGRPLFERT